MPPIRLLAAAFANRFSSSLYIDSFILYVTKNFSWKFRRTSSSLLEYRSPLNLLLTYKTKTKAKFIRSKNLVCSASLLIPELFHNLWGGDGRQRIKFSDPHENVTGLKELFLEEGAKDPFEKS